MSFTEKSFQGKWENNKNAFFSETLREGSTIQNWILRRNGYTSLAKFGNRLSNCARILDAGCGNGRVTALIRSVTARKINIVGIDAVGAEVARSNLVGYENVDFFTMDLTNDLSSLGKFDYIYCQEVLHHTKDPQRSFGNLCAVLADGGEIAVYVYKEKAPVREFVDDFVRRKIEKLSYDEAMNFCRQVTDFGRSLSRLDQVVDVPEVDILGIPAGEYSVQRLIYHFFAKCFWNDELSYHENVLINYDWYHPQLASRHSLEEVRSWFDNNNLDIVHQFVDEYGITIRGVKRS